MSSKFRRTIGMMIIPLVILGIALLLMRRNEPMPLSAAISEATVGPTNPDSFSLVSTPEVTAENSEFAYCPSQSSTFAIDQALSFITSEARFLSRTNDSKAPVYRYYTALSTLNYVQTLVSPMRYPDVVTAVGQEAVNSFGPEELLVYRAGVCGNQIETYMALMDDLGIPTRDVQFYWLDIAGNRATHIGVEVQWDAEWHFFDVTWGMFAAPADNPMEVASLTQILSDTEHRLTRFTNWAYSLLLVNRIQNYDEFQYLSTTPGNIDILIDGNGTIRPYWIGHQITFANIPNYVGYVQSQSGNMGHLRDVIAVPPGTQSLDIQIRAQACVGAGSLKINDQRIPLTMEAEKTMTIDTANTSTVELDVIRPGDDSCYVVFDQITANTTAPEITPSA